MPRAAVRDVVHATAEPEAGPQSAAPRYCVDPSGHGDVQERLRSDEAETTDGIEFEKRWSPGASLLLIVFLSSACWAVIGGAVWAVAG